MKYLLITIFILAGLTGQQQQKPTLKGKYKMRFEKEFSSQNGSIAFEKNTYTRRQADGKQIKGTVEYAKNVVLLNDDNKVYRIEVLEKTIGKDTVSFRTIELSKVADKRGDMVFYTGKMIKQKQK